MVKKAEHRRTDVFELWCWRRFLKVLWTAKRSNQSILRETNSEYSLERLMLKLQYLGQLMQTANSLEKTLMLGPRVWPSSLEKILMLGKIEGREEGKAEDEMFG